MEWSSCAVANSPAVTRIGVSQAAADRARRLVWRAPLLHRLRHLPPPPTCSPHSRPYPLSRIAVAAGLVAIHPAPAMAHFTTLPVEIIDHIVSFVRLRVYTDRSRANDSRYPQPSKSRSRIYRAPANRFTIPSFRPFTAACAYTLPDMGRGIRGSRF